MNQQIREFSDKLSGFWNSVSKKNKILYIGLFLLVIAALSLTIYFTTKPTYIPLYSNEMSQSGIGDIKAELDREGYSKYRLENNGTSISVPEKDASNLLVSLASKGLPKTGTISFSDMTKNLQFGATDRQLNAMEREALQGQVADLLTHVNGVKSAQVIISEPEESLFARQDDNGKATASVVLQLQPGYELDPKQIQTLYHLVSKSIPNLPKENIVMTDQDGTGLDDASQQSTSATDNFEQQRKIQHDVEADIQKSLQQMLGTIIGPNKVIVQTYVRLNFDQVKEKDSLVEPVKKDTNEGIAVSAEKINKTYSGNDTPSGTSGTGQTDVTGYAASGSSSQNNKSSDIESRVNYEVNRISKDIVQSPYKIDDMTINVGVEPPNPKNPNSLTAATKSNIQQILSNVVATALSGNPNLTSQNVNSRITVFPREFSGNALQSNSQQKAGILPSWLLYTLIGAGALLIVLFLFLVLRRKKRDKEEELDPFPVFQEAAVSVANVENTVEEKVAIKEQIEEMARQQPEQFVGLLRNWLNKD
jgi:flagellar M-ring protein FliF